MISPRDGRAAEAALDAHFLGQLLQVPFVHASIVEFLASENLERDERRECQTVFPGASRPLPDVADAPVHRPS